MNRGIDLEGKMGVVTGASSGIGRAIAIALAAEGMKLLLLGRNTDALRETAEAAGRGSGGLRVIRCDLGDDRGVREAGDRISADFPSVDVLVHSAGILEPGEIRSTPVEVLDRHYQINVRAPYLLTRTLLPAILKRRGQVVFINSSISRQKGRAGFSHYHASKMALAGLADVLRDEVNSHGVRVLSVYPGRTATPMQGALFAAGGKEYTPERLMQPEDVAEAVIGALQLPLTAEVTDIEIRPML